MIVEAGRKKEDANRSRKMPEGSYPWTGEHGPARDVARRSPDRRLLLLANQQMTCILHITTRPRARAEGATLKKALPLRGPLPGQRDLQRGRSTLSNRDRARKPRKSVSSPPSAMGTRHILRCEGRKCSRKEVRTDIFYGVSALSGATGPSAGRPIRLSA